MSDEEDDKEEVSVLKMPDKLKRAIKATAHYEVRTLRDVFAPFLAQTEDRLLHDPKTPTDCQLAMTAFLLKKQEMLQEVMSSDEQNRIIVSNAAQECPIYGRGRR
jgi:hypothetical protein